MKNILKYFLFLVILFSCEAILAQMKFKVTIKFPSQLDIEKIHLSYDNGIKRSINVEPNFKDNQVIISEDFYSRYATIFINYQNNLKRFFVGDKPAWIIVYENDSIT